MMSALNLLIKELFHVLLNKQQQNYREMTSWVVEEEEVETTANEKTAKWTKTSRSHSRIHKYTFTLMSILQHKPEWIWRMRKLTQYEN